ncbi:MAG: ATP-binding protein [Mariniphaga sp.]
MSRKSSNSATSTAFGKTSTTGAQMSLSSTLQRNAKLPGTSQFSGLRRISRPLPAANSMKLISDCDFHQQKLRSQEDKCEDGRKGVIEIDEKYADFFEIAPSAFFILSRKGKINDANINASNMLGYNRSDLIGKKFNLFVSDQTKLIFTLFLNKVFSSQCNTFCEAVLTIPGNQPIDIYLSGVIAKDGEQCFITAVDFTQHKKAERDIQLKNEYLQQNNIEKNKFISIIAHDLRSPLGGFIGLTELMSEGLSGMTSDEIQQIAFLMRKSSTNIFRLLEDLLEWSRMQQGLTLFVPKSFKLIAKIGDGLVLALEAAKAKDITIFYAIPEDLKVFADSNMLEFIIRNLVTYAVKFTHKGGLITVSAKAVSNQEVEIKIEDTGIGMDEKMLKNLFLLHVNTNRQGTMGESTSGLGLILCKDFIEKLGGKLLVESHEGKGSTFRFTLKTGSVSDEHILSGQADA